MGLVFFSDNGYVVHKPDPYTSKDFAPLQYQVDNFQGRIPVIVKGRDLYTGEPNWYHHDVISHHGIDSNQWDNPHGYFNGSTLDWGKGNLKWYGGADTADMDDEMHQGVSQALMDAGYQIKNPDHMMPEDGFDDSDLWSDDLPGLDS